MADNQSKEVWNFLSHCNKDYEKVRQDGNTSVLESESGTFYIDENGIVQRFEPSDGNPFIDEKTDLNDNYIHSTEKSIRTLIITDPCGQASSFGSHHLYDGAWLRIGMFYI